MDAAKRDVRPIFFLIRTASVSEVLRINGDRLNGLNRSSLRGQKERACAEADLHRIASSSREELLEAAHNLNLP